MDTTGNGSSGLTTTEERITSPGFKDLITRTTAVEAEETSRTGIGSTITTSTTIVLEIDVAVVLITVVEDAAGVEIEAEDFSMESRTSGILEIAGTLETGADLRGTGTATGATHRIQ